MIVSYELAKLAKEKRFNEECDYVYEPDPNIGLSKIILVKQDAKVRNNNLGTFEFAAPTVEHIKLWMMAKYKMELIFTEDTENSEHSWSYKIIEMIGFDENGKRNIVLQNDAKYSTKDEATIEGIIEVLTFAV